MREPAPRVKRALVSVHDKSGLADLGLRLTACEVELISTGGTARFLRESGLQVLDVARITGFPEILDGRVKTLHPCIHGGILYRGSQDDATLDKHGIRPIQLVVVNLYPFVQMVEQGNMSETAIMEYIDIGGPTMLRAAAKNFAQVIIVTDPADYPAVLEELESGRTVSLATRRRLAARAFGMVAEYDSAIADYMSHTQ